MEYDVFARYYDRLNTDLDYCARTEYLLSLFRRFGATPNLLLDLGCGTGGFSLAFSKKGIEVIGVDPSEAMLCEARKKAGEAGASVLFLNQSGQTLDLYGTVDGAVCCMDTLNHITDKRGLRRCFEKVSLFLEPGRLFIFDVNTLYKQKQVLADRVYVLEEKELFCVWENHYLPRQKTTDIVLNFFEKCGNVYRREEEVFSERVYSRRELERLLKGAGFRVEAVFADLTESKIRTSTQRAVYVARKVI